MLFNQLFDPASCTYTYLVADENTREAVLIDPVLEQVERDLGVLRDHGLRLKYTLDTHVHADHVTAALALKHPRSGAPSNRNDEKGKPASPQRAIGKPVARRTAPPTGTTVEGKANPRVARR
jgi:sulfur dioxygenase